MTTIAVVPAAGISRRMGQPKLPLPLGDSTVIGRVVRALKDGGVDRLLVVLPHYDTPGRKDVQNAVTAAWGDDCVLFVLPDDPPPDMRASLQLGLAGIDVERSRNPALAPFVLITPADCIGLTPTVVARVIDAATRNPGKLVLPTHAGKRGHPLALPVDLIAELYALPANVGLNQLVRQHEADLLAIPVADPGVISDLDTPEEYDAFVNAESDIPRTHAFQKVVVRLFAVARQLAGASSVDVYLEEDATVGRLRVELARQVPALAFILWQPGVRIAVADSYVDDAHILPPDAEVAVIPPVSGGAPDGF